MESPGRMIYDVIVIGGGQAGLACGYYLKKAGLTFVILDEQQSAGGAWQQSWDSLTLFSPAEYSSLPGWMMPRSEHYFPKREEVIEYLAQYESRYDVPVQRPVSVTDVEYDDRKFRLRTTQSIYEARAIISATGTWHHPFIPEYSDRDLFAGLQIHSAEYRTPERFRNMQVLVVGEGNSGAQIVAEVSIVATTTWVARHEPKFLPDDVDGRVLFHRASARYAAAKDGKPIEATHDLGSIVMVPPVKEARDRGVLVAKRPFERLTNSGVVWNDGKEQVIDAIIWCTGFRASLDHLRSLNVVEANGRIATLETRSTVLAGLWLVGYGNWTGFASATLIGVGRTAKRTVEEIRAYLTNAGST